MFSSHFLHAYIWIAFRVGHDLFLVNPSQFISHNIMRRRTDSVLTYPTIKTLTVSIKYTSCIIHINLTDFGNASGDTERAMCQRKRCPGSNCNAIWLMSARFVLHCKPQTNWCEKVSFYSPPPTPRDSFIFLYFCLVSLSCYNRGGLITSALICGVNEKSRD